MTEPKNDYFAKVQKIKSAVTSLRSKSEAILSTKPELFQTIIIEPEHVLSKDQLKHIEKQSSFLCSNEQLQLKIKECSESKPEENAAFLEAAINQIKRGVYDHSEIKGKVGKTDSQLQKELIKEFSAKLEAVKYGEKYPEINALNKKVLDFRSAGLSLYEEFAEQQAEYEKTLKEKALKNEETPIKKAIYEEFKDIGSAKWNTKASTATSENAVAVRQIPKYEYSEALVIEPKLSTTSTHKDSIETMQNLMTKSYYFVDGQMGAMQVAYVKDHLLPAAINAMCTVRKVSSTISDKLEDLVDLSNSFEKFEFVATNFKTIFKGFDTDYYEKIIVAADNIADIRINHNTGATDLTYYTQGIHKIIEMTRHVELQHGLPQSKVINDLVAECPDYAHEFLGDSQKPLMLAGSDSAVHTEL